MVPLLTFEDLSLERLRQRRSVKWRTYPPDVLPAWVAEMDFALAEPVRRALLDAVERDDTGYPHADGLGEAFAEFAAARFGWAVDPGHVVVTADVMAGVVQALHRFTEPGDGVVINPPVYPPFFSVLAEAERRVVEAPLAPRGAGWELDLDTLEHAFAAGARAYLLCNPHNPTGAALSRAVLERIADLASRYGVAVVSDEIHAPLTLSGAIHTPFVTLGPDAARGRTVTLTSASKAWNLAGLKAAVLVPGSPFAQALVADVRSADVGHLGVLAATAAYCDGGPWLDGLIAHLDRNRRLLTDLLADRLPGVGYVPPQAGYLAWLDCRPLDLGPDPAAAFLHRGRVALSPGPTFGRQGRGWARLNMGTSTALLTEAVDRMAASL